MTRTRGEDDGASVTLSHSGLKATIEADRHVPGSFELIVDGTPQSHVNMGDPGSLFFEYVQRMGHVIDVIGEPGRPLTAVHLGAGALTLPRYVEATRPGSTQHVIELEPRLVELVRGQLPWSRRARIRVRYGDARDVLVRLPAGLHGSVDLVVVDIFSGAQTPAHVTTREFFAGVEPLLSPHGIVLVNVTDGPGLAFARTEAATVASVFGHAIALADTQTFKGRRFGNIVLAASRNSINSDWIPRIRARGPHPASVVAGDEFVAFVAGAPIATDATAMASPLPGRTVFQIRRSGEGDGRG